MLWCLTARPRSERPWRTISRDLENTWRATVRERKKCVPPVRASAFTNHLVCSLVSCNIGIMTDDCCWVKLTVGTSQINTIIHSLPDSPPTHSHTHPTLTPTHSHTHYTLPHIPHPHTLHTPTHIPPSPPAPSHTSDTYPHTTHLPHPLHTSTPPTPHTPYTLPHKASTSFSSLGRRSVMLPPSWSLTTPYRSTRRR